METYETHDLKLPEFFPDEVRQACDIDLSERQIDQFEQYYSILTEWNEKINLTRITEPEAVSRLHFIDSIMPSAKTDLSGKRLIDVGTGAGFPGIPLKIIFPSADIVLLDSLDKRCRFLNEVISLLKLDEEESIRVIHARAEDAASPVNSENLRGSFDYAVSRAVANLSTLCEYTVPFLKTGGSFIAYKMTDSDEEYGSSQKAMEVLGVELDKRDNYILPGTTQDRCLYYIKKIRKTPDKYPRRAGTPERKPL